ncbi:progestin and adipoQ receptor family member 4 isoform X1 [Struthio camelus]|uniref:progestin and adipoQ receptor family member 4 isoform X1 n=1 Tax=Struthio camelus TaxID=8801 RepID=UPI003603BC31
MGLGDTLGKAMGLEEAIGAGGHVGLGMETGSTGVFWPSTWVVAPSSMPWVSLGGDAVGQGHGAGGSHWGWGHVGLGDTWGSGWRRALPALNLGGSTVVNALGEPWGGRRGAGGCRGAGGHVGQGHGAGGSHWGWGTRGARDGDGLYRHLLAPNLGGGTIVNALGAVPIIYCALPCRPGPCGAALAAYGALCGLALWGAVGAASRGGRLAAFAGPTLFRLAVVGLRAAGGLGAQGALAPYARMEALALLGGLVNLARVPERWRPGAFDYWANSHQLMHLLVALAILHLHWGVAADLHWAARHPCPPA